MRNTFTFSFAAVVASICLWASPAAAQVLSIGQVESIIRAVHDGERMNWGASSTREQRNEDWAQVIGVVHWGHPVYNPTPDPSWCIKDAGNGRPQSDDVVVQCAARTFWDCVPSAGANGYRIECGGHGAERLPSVQNVYAPPKPTRIKGSGTPGPTPTPTPPPATVNLQPLLDRLAALEQLLATKVDAVAALALDARNAAQAVQADAESARINASDIRHVELPKVLEALKGAALTVPCMTGSVYGRRVRFCPEAP